MAKGLLVLLLAALLLVEPVAASESAFAAAAVEARQNGQAGGGMGKTDAAPGKTGKGKGRGKGLTDWAKKLRGQMPAKFDDKAAKKIFDSAAGALPQKPRLSVDQLKAKGWHYQIKDEETTATAADGSDSVQPSGYDGLKHAYGSSASAEGKKNAKANKSPKLDVTDPETIKKDEAKYAKAKAWREQMMQQRKVRAFRCRLLLRPPSRCSRGVQLLARRCSRCPDC